MSTATETRSAVAHLVRRAGFGGHPDEVDAPAGLGYEGAVDQVCQLDDPDRAADAIPLPTLDSAGFPASSSRLGAPSSCGG